MWPTTAAYDVATARSGAVHLSAEDQPAQDHHSPGLVHDGVIDEPLVGTERERDAPLIVRPVVAGVGIAGRIFQQLLDVTAISRRIASGKLARCQS